MISSHMLTEIEGICNKIIFINNGEVVNIKQIDIRNILSLIRKIIC